MKKYIITNKNIVYLFKDLIIYSVIIFCWILFLYYYIGDDWNFFIYLILFTIAPYLCIMLIPVLYIYENYEYYNKKLILKLNEDNIQYNDDIIFLSDIKKIIIYATYQYFNGKEGGVTSLPYNPYFYHIEITTRNKKYYLTSLLGFSIAEDLQEFYPHLEYEKIIKSYPLIKKE